jgi:hypothetical protein
MDPLGVIRAATDPPGISHERWIGLIREHPNLAPPEPRQLINPFTKAPTTIHPRPDVACVVLDGREVGRMSWSEEESNEVYVFGDEHPVVPLAREIAGRLGGSFEASTA